MQGIQEILHQLILVSSLLHRGQERDGKGLGAEKEQSKQLMVVSGTQVSLQIFYHNSSIGSKHWGTGAVRWIQKTFSCCDSIYSSAEC